LKTWCSSNTLKKMNKMVLRIKLALVVWR